MVRPSSPVRAVLATVLSFAIGLILLAPVMARPDPGAGLVALDAGVMATHLVISELATGGASASDELVELYNPTAMDRSLDGLEVVYASASGLTITRKATWDSTAPPIPPGGHLLIANAAGAFAAMADATYANGLAATGGSLALRAADTQAVVDSLAWGTANAFLEGDPAPAPPAGSSLERLPGGSAGSGQDTDDNATDFVVREVPDPQNAASDPVPQPTPSPTATATGSPSPTPGSTPTPLPATPAPTPAPATPTPTPVLTPTPTPTPLPSPSITPTPTPTTISIADARALPDGSAAEIAGTALMGSEFGDGGGCVDDGSGGIAVLPDGAAFPRGALVAANGVVDDRYAQRTLRVDAVDLVLSGTGSDPAPETVLTDAVGEPYECRLVRVSGLVQGVPTQLSSGLAFDLDDGSGSARVLVASAAAIDTTSWSPGATLTVIGAVGQRDSSGTGTAGYRVQPRDSADVVSILPSATPTPFSSPSSSPAPSGSDSPALVSIAQARVAAKGATVRVRGVVTLQTGLVDASTAVIQDGTAAIVVRLGENAGTARRGTLIEVVGTRSTKAGMETIRTDLAPMVLGSQAEPSPAAGTTGRLGEASEARLVSAVGEVTSAVVRSTAGNTTFSLDDGSGEIRVTLFAAAEFPAGAVRRGAWIEVTAVLGQETTGALPERGYRLWPRDLADLRVITPASAGAADTPATSGPPTRQSTATAVSRDRMGTADLVVPRIAAGGPGATASTGGGRASPGAEGQRTAGEVLLASAVTAPPRAAVVSALLALVLGLMLLAGWRAGTLQRLRQALAARIEDGGPTTGEEPG